MSSNSGCVRAAQSYSMRRYIQEQRIARKLVVEQHYVEVIENGGARVERHAYSLVRTVDGYLKGRKVGRLNIAQKTVESKGIVKLDRIGIKGKRDG